MTQSDPKTLNGRRVFGLPGLCHSQLPGVRSRVRRHGASPRAVFALDAAGSEYGVPVPENGLTPADTREGVSLGSIGVTENAETPANPGFLSSCLFYEAAALTTELPRRTRCGASYDKSRGKSLARGAAPSAAGLAGHKHDLAG